MAWIGAAASIVGGLISSNAARSASKSQSGASDAAIGEQARQYDQTREDFAPYRAAGTNALSQLVDEMGRPVTSAEVMSDPGYQFGLQQGQLGLDRKIAAMGGRVSGRALKAASEFNQGYATTGYNAAYQRRQDRQNRLAAIAGIGQTATGSSAAAGSQSANAISGLLSSQGDARAASQLYQGNLWTNTGNQLAALYGRKTATPSYWNSGTGGAGSTGVWGGTAEDPWYG